MTLNRMFASVAIASLAIICVASPAIASASPRDDSSVDTTNLTDVPDIDSLADCAEEDGSGSASLPCVWINDGNAWITYSDHSVLVIDDTVS